MSLNKEYISQMSKEKSNYGGYNWLDVNLSEKLLKDVKVLSFYKLYSTLIVQFYNEGLIDIPEDDSKKIEYYLNKPHLIKTDETVRRFVNGYYGILSSTNKYKISRYAYLMMEDILYKNKNIIYIDTDMIFYNGELNLLGIDLPANELEIFEFLVIARKKVYVYYKNNKFFHKGFYLHKMYKVENYVSEMKVEIRESKLNKILS